MEVRRIEERYCPQLGKNVPLEVRYSPSGDRVESCMGRETCGCGKQECVHRADPLAEDGL